MKLRGEIEKINSGSAQAGQIMCMLFFIPFLFLLLYIVIVNFSMDLLIFVIILTTIIIFIFKNAFSYADIYIKEGNIIIKKIFFTRSKKLSDIKEIDRAFLPITYSILFKDNFKVYFMARVLDIFKQFFSSDPDKLTNRIKDNLLLDDSNPANSNKK